MGARHGAELPADAAEDSISFLPLLDGRAGPAPRDHLILHSINGSFGLRVGPWKLELCADSGGWSAPRPGRDSIEGLLRFQLYDLAADPDESFDVVFTRFSAHHWRDVPAALKEAKRVVKNDGRAAFADAVSPGVPVLDTYLQGIELLRDPSHVRDYSVEEWKAMLRDAGFRPGAVTLRRLPLDFAPWCARMRVSPEMAQAIRSVQSKMAGDVVRHFDIRSDGSFTLDVAVIEAEPV